MYDPIAVLRNHARTARAIIFDVDGVLVDSESHHFLAHQMALAEFGVNIDKAFYIAYGVSTDPISFYRKAFHKETLPVRSINRILNRKQQIYKKLQDEEGIQPIEEATTLVSTLYSLERPLAAASAVSKDEVNYVLQSLGIHQCFRVVVAGDEFGLRNKPAPDIYLKTAELLGVPSRDCIAIEDSGNGAASAIKAGMTCVVVPNEYTRTHVFAGAIVLDSFLKIGEIMIDAWMKQ